MWNVKIYTNETKAPLLADGIADLCDSLSYFEDESGNPNLWIILGYFQNKPCKQTLNQIELLGNILGIQDLEIILEKTASKDWVKEVQSNFNPIEAGDFFVYSSWNRPSKIADNIIAIEIDPQNAFGTGHHETTKMCLEAISNFKAQGEDFDKILDIGCGSGILSIGAAKAWNKAKIFGVDIDSDSVATCINNAKINNIKAQFACADGTNSSLIQNNAKYDLILANILATPLIEMVQDIRNICNNNGKIILSGFYDKTQESVISAYADNFTIIDQLIVNDWCCLVINKR